MIEEKFAAAVSQVNTAMAELAGLMTDPDALPFPVIRPHLERLEDSSADKAAVDAAFSWCAELHEAGRIVGSSRTEDYLVGKLALSRTEARSRLRQARALYAPPPPPPPPDDTDPDADRAAQARRAEREAAAQRDARQQKASAAKRAVIDQELEKISPHAQPGRTEILAQALAEAASRSVEDLRAWVREQVRRANAAARLPNGKKDHLAPYRKRSVSFSAPDADGGVRFHGYLPAEQAAVVKAALDPLRNRVEEKDGVHLRQRRADLLVQRCAASSDKGRYGSGSVVVSMTVDDIKDMTPHSLFPTNTGDLLDPFALVRLGAAQFDFFAVHDEQGRVIDVGRGSRTANFYQRIALFAQELVCTHPGCDRPLNDCQVHHLTSWGQGGATDLDNLALLCWGHHRDNCDSRDGRGGFGHAARDPDSGRSGFQAAGSPDIEFNDTVAQQRSAGAKIRGRRSWDV